MIQARLIVVVTLIFIALYNLQRVLVDTEKLITAIYGTARLIHSFIAQAILENSVIAFEQLQLVRTRSFHTWTSLSADLYQRLDQLETVSSFQLT